MVHENIGENSEWHQLHLLQCLERLCYILQKHQPPPNIRLQGRKQEQFHDEAHCFCFVLQSLACSTAIIQISQKKEFHFQKIENLADNQASIHHYFNSYFLVESMYQSRLNSKHKLHVNACDRLESILKTHSKVSAFLKLHKLLSDMYCYGQHQKPIIFLSSCLKAEC